MAPRREADELEPRGAVLRPAAARRAFTIDRYRPSPALSPFVTHYWFVRWDLEEPYTQSVLPRPAVNLVSEPGRLLATGPSRRRFDRELGGRGAVFGVLFRPAGFSAFHPEALVDTGIDFAERAGVDAAALHRELLEDPDDASRVARLESLLSAQSPVPYEGMTELDDIIELALRSNDITRAEDLAERAGVALRTLQRRLKQRVGLGPKALLRRFRLLEAAARLAENDAIDHATLAQALGYSDQAHFVRDFAAVVGHPPGAYAAAVRADGSRARAPRR